MRISDWSSDVCSSDLPATPDVKQVSYWGNACPATVHAAVIWTFSALRKKGVEKPSVAVLSRSNSLISDLSVILSEPHTYNNQQIGRASCRERVCQYV